MMLKLKNSITKISNKPATLESLDGGGDDYDDDYDYVDINKA
jgi:hypothetical protein